MRAKTEAPRSQLSGFERGSAPASFATARLALSLVCETDGENLIALERDPAVMRFLNGGRAAPADTVDGPAVFLTPRGREDDVWAAIETFSGAFVGWFSLRTLRRDLAELGFRLKRDMWGRGYATEGAAALVGKGFAEMGLERIVASTMAVNHASRRVMEKAGLIHMRTSFPRWAAPLPGSEMGEVEYEITRQAWETERARLGWE